MTPQRLLAFFLASCVLLLAHARAQCNEWRTGFSSPSGGANGRVNASIVFDDGSGPALYIAGSFSIVTSEVDGGLGVTFGDGLRCAGGSTARSKTALNSGGSSQYPGVGDPSVSVRGSVSAPGSRTYQTWYRGAPAFCTSATFNLTNALKCVWAP